MYLKHKRLEDKKYLDSYRDRRCCTCGNPNSVAHHIRFGSDCGTSLKPNDDCCIPLCVNCHKECHEGEKKFYDKHWFTFNGNVILYAKELYKKYLQN